MAGGHGVGTLWGDLGTGAGNGIVADSGGAFAAVFRSGGDVDAGISAD